MSEFKTVLEAVLPVFGIALIGLVVRKLNWLTEEADHSLLRLNINVLFPCLILDAAIGNRALFNVGNLVLAPTVGFVTVAAGLFIALWACRLNGLKGTAREGTFAVTVGIYNYGYVPLPLALMLFSNETAGVLFVHNVGVEFAMWTLGVMLFTRGAGKDWRKFVNGPLLAIVLALVINALGLHAFVPAVVKTTLHWVGQCAIPMSLVLIGAVVADFMGESHAGWDWKVMGSAIGVRIILLPILFLLLAKYLPASVELKRVIILEAAMPSAVFPIVMSRHYGGDPATALRVVLGTSLVGFITIPLWIRLGMKFVAPEL